MSELDQAAALLTHTAAHVAHHGRRVDVYTMAHVVCRQTRRQRGPTVKDAAGNEIRHPLVNRLMRATGEWHDGAYPGAYQLVGSPDDIVADMVQMSERGLAGTSVAFLDYLKEIPYFVQEVLCGWSV